MMTLLLLGGGAYLLAALLIALDVRAYRRSRRHPVLDQLSYHMGEIDAERRHVA